MEKIQEALAKARSVRESRDQTASPAAPVVAAASKTSASPTVDEAVRQAWARLERYDASPERLERGHVATLKGGPDAAPFDVMRTKLIQTMRTNNWRRLAITSPSAGCGKSTVALNLAFSLARQTDIRTILAELDLRRPSLAKTLGVTPARNFSDVLDGRADFADQALRFGDNLALALNASVSRNPAELLHGGGVADRLSAIEAIYAPDLTIFDMPPMLINDDMMAFAGKVDCVLLIAGAEKTTVKEIDTCERELSSQTNVMGVVLNKCRYMGEDYGYGY
jgi:protein-tyrosine kinase